MYRGVILLASVTACTAPSGGGEECEWELKNRSKSYSLTIVSSTRTYLTTVTLPPAPRPAPKGPTAKMPIVKPPKPTKKPSAGYVWVLDCD